jgi:hypothetical protein
VEAVAGAARILHDDQDNMYYRIAILRTRLWTLTGLSVLVLLGWLVLAPNMGAEIGEAMPDLPQPLVWRLQLTQTHIFWLAIMVAGVAGAVFSGFTVAIEPADRASIPRELQTTSLTVARLALGSVSAVFFATFLLAGMSTVVVLSYGALLAAAFVAGFSERILVQAVQALTSNSSRPATPAPTPAPAVPTREPILSVLLSPRAVPGGAAGDSPPGPSVPAEAKP